MTDDAPSSALFRKVLVANRGEIAVRIIRALREMGIASVALTSDADANALHARLADERVHLGGGPVTENYLQIDRIIAAALDTGAEAIHPGYGLLAETAGFADACERAGLVFVGPSAGSIRAMGSKVEARALMQSAGVPVVPGAVTTVKAPEDARRIAEQVGYPVVVKASGGGGGRGMRVAYSADELDAALTGAADEGEKFFGDARVYLEKYLEDPRHVEVQVVADGHGSIVHLFERDCSVQRRHQKLIEESPAPALSETQRREIGRIAVEAARAVDYVSLGTVEGLYDDGQFYFLEMNTRIQVEHPVTEMVTGIDLVHEQLRIAAGFPLSFAQDDVVVRGHAIECRINCEDATRGFLPRPGTITRFDVPAGPNIRVDSGVEAGAEVSPYYDPLLAKLIVWGETRADATQRMLEALEAFTVEGVPTLVPFHRHLLASEEWEGGETCRNLVTDRAWLKATGEEPRTAAMASAADLHS